MIFRYITALSDLYSLILAKAIQRIDYQEVMPNICSSRLIPLPS